MVHWQTLASDLSYLWEAETWVENKGWFTALGLTVISQRIYWFWNSYFPDVKYSLICISSTSEKQGLGAMTKANYLLFWIFLSKFEMYTGGRSG